MTKNQEIIAIAEKKERQIIITSNPIIISINQTTLILIDFHISKLFILIYFLNFQQYQISINSRSELNI